MDKTRHRFDLPLTEKYSLLPILNYLSRTEQNSSIGFSKTLWPNRLPFTFHNTRKLSVFGKESTSAVVGYWCHIQTTCLVRRTSPGQRKPSRSPTLFLFSPTESTLSAHLRAVIWFRGSLSLIQSQNWSLSHIYQNFWMAFCQCYLILKVSSCSQGMQKVSVRSNRGCPDCNGDPTCRVSS